MIFRVAALALVVAAPAAFAMGYWQGQHATAPALTIPVRTNPPLLTKPGVGSAGAAKYFATLNAPPPPPRPFNAPPPPPDIGLLFRREVSAVLTGQTPHVVLTGGKLLAKGEVYRDGWKVRDVRNDSVTLVKGAETRSINLFSVPPQAAIAAAQPAFGLNGPISLTNGQQAGKLTAGQVNRIVDAFKAAGMTQQQLDQLRRSLENGGTMNLGQVMQSMQGLLRGRQLTQGQISGIIQAFAAANVVPAQLVPQLTQQMMQMQQAQQLQGVFGGPGGGRGGGNGGFGGGFGGGGRGPNGAFNAPAGGGGGRRGGLGLTPPPSTLLPGAQPPAVTAPSSAPATGRPLASRSDPNLALAAVSGPTSPYGTTIR